MTKKAQGLPFNAIVIAALVLVVLVVLILIFTGKIGFFSKGAEGAKEMSCLALNTQKQGAPYFPETYSYSCMSIDECDVKGGVITGVATPYKDCNVLEKICCKIEKAASE